MQSSTQQMLNSSEKRMSEDSWMWDLDPMLEGGYRVVYYRPFPVQMRYLDNEQKQVGHRQILQMRIMVNPSPQNYSSLKLQITSEDNLFMSYIAKIDEKKYQRIRKGQSLNFGYNSLLNMLIKQLNNCDKNPQQYTTLFHISNTAPHRLDFNQNIQYKTIQLLSLDFESLDEQMSQQCISYRFSHMKAKNQRVQIKIKQMYNMIKLKNPNLLQNIVKKTSKYPLLSQFLSK